MKIQCSSCIGTGRQINSAAFRTLGDFPLGILALLNPASESWMRCPICNGRGYIRVKWRYQWRRLR
jgi:hypothetical protein